MWKACSTSRNKCIESYIHPQPAAAIAYSSIQRRKRRVYRIHEPPSLPTFTPVNLGPGGQRREEGSRGPQKARAHESNLKTVEDRPQGPTPDLIVPNEGESLFGRPVSCKTLFRTVEDRHVVGEAQGYE